MQVGKVADRQAEQDATHQILFIQRRLAQPFVALSRHHLIGFVIFDARYDHGQTMLTNPH